jgi:hypothetical protein
MLMMLLLKIWTISTLKMLDTRLKWSSHWNLHELIFRCPLVDLDHKPMLYVPLEIIPLTILKNSHYKGITKGSE